MAGSRSPAVRSPIFLRNRFYLGEVVFNGEVLPGEQRAILDRDLFDAVQAKLNKQRTNRAVARGKSEAVLIGRIYDDRGNRMTPSHARKGSIKYRYYVSSALIHGQAEDAGSISRASAAELDALVVNAVRDHLKGSAPTDDRDLINAHLIRVEVHRGHLIVQLGISTRKSFQPEGDHGQSGPRSKDRSGTADNNVSHDAPIDPADAVDDDRQVLRVPWKKTSMNRRREIIVPASVSSRDPRPIRAETRATLVASIARGRHWLNEIVAGTVTSVEQIAARDKCSIRQVNMTISLAFLAPELVKAAVEGRLPRGIGVTRLRDAPAEWSRQYAMLGLSV